MTVRAAPRVEPVSPPVVLRAGSRIPVLDGLRGIAILLVLFNNLYRGPGTGHIAYPLGRAFYSGWIGVDLFFVLSGFLITGLLLETRGSEHYFRNFYARRFLRIFPLYYGFLVAWLALIPHLPVFTASDVAGVQSRQIWYWLYLSNMIPAHSGISGAEPTTFWSLAVEEQFYLLWPLVIALVPRRRLATFCLGVMGAAFTLRVLWRALDPGPRTHDLLYSLLPARMDALAAGALVAVVLHGPGWKRLQPFVGPAALAGAGALGGIFVVQRGLRPSTLLMQTTGYSLLACTFALTTAWLVMSRSEPGARLVAHPALQFLGRYSYGVYVFHGAIYLLLIHWAWYASPPELWGTAVPAALLGWVLASGASLVLALISWHAYEKWWLTLKRWFPYPR